MCEPGILRLCCIVQYVSWCPYFMHCELNHVGPVTSDATTCFSVKNVGVLVCSIMPLLLSPLPHQQKVVCAVVPALLLHCVFCCAMSPDCPPYSTAPSPRTDHHSPTRTTSNSCQPWTTLGPWTAHLQPDQHSTEADEVHQYMVT